jgi:phosphate transport system substrate-binding protein
MKMLTAILAAVALTVACGGGSSGPVRPPSEGSPSGTVQINGAGATFPYPVYSKWFSEYNTLHPTVQINYQPIGSGGGIRQLVERTVFFGASDQPMSDEMLAKAPGPILHFPTVLGAVVPIYNIDGLNTQIEFTGPILADIYLGKITKWNDPALAKINAGVALPSMNITVVHRSDGSGTTFVFADYLSKISPEWKQKVGANSSLNWPVGVGGKGNEGVAGLVTQSPGSLGYVELVYALQSKIAYGAVQNQTGEFVNPDIKSVTAAAAGAMPTMPKDFRVSITNAPGTGAYPISSFTWILLYENPENKNYAGILNDFMTWALSNGQPMAEALGYARLPDALIAAELEQLKRIQVP